MNCRQGFGGEIQVRLLGRPRCKWEDNIKIDLK